MQSVEFPIDFKFHIGTLANDFTATDASGNTIAFVRQKIFKFFDEVQIFTDSSKSQLLYTIKANKWIDFSATYSFYDAQGNIIGSVARKGWTSIWKARYDIFDETKHLSYHIREDNPWTKVGDSFFSEIPLIGIFTGYVFNPSYSVIDNSGNKIARLKKQASFFGRKFSVEKSKQFVEVDTDRILLSLMMMILLERRRG
ncbi:LURP-one-related/scramblase family protein [Rhizosphaericola mali]|nr:hypothetical protein [Rhizosphaericola mali]